MNLGLLKRPKVFVTIAEIIFSIVAFSVLASYSDTLTFKFVCDVVSSQSSSQQSGSKNKNGAANFRPQFLYQPRFAPDARERVPNTMGNLLAANSIQDALAHDAVKSMRRATRSGARVPTNDAKESTKEDDKKTIICNVIVQYPFKLDKYANQSDCIFCDDSLKHIIVKDTSSSMAIFFMFVAVISFIYGLVMIPLYFVEDDMISKLPFFPTLDLIVHAIFLIFWICASISWAAGIANLKHDTSEEQITQDNYDNFECETKDCSVIPPDTYGATVTSVIFGFINLLLYGANLLFVFKDEAFQT